MNNKLKEISEKMKELNKLYERTDIDISDITKNMEYILVTKDIELLVNIGKIRSKAIDDIIAIFPEDIAQSTPIIQYVYEELKNLISKQKFEQMIMTSMLNYMKSINDLTDKHFEECSEGRNTTNKWEIDCIRRRISLLMQVVDKSIDYDNNTKEQIILELKGILCGVENYDNHNLSMPNIMIDIINESIIRIIKMYNIPVNIQFLLNEDLKVFHKGLKEDNKNE